jgi:hypothetical protein
MVLEESSFGEELVPEEGSGGSHQRDLLKSKRDRHDEVNDGEECLLAVILKGRRLDFVVYGDARWGTMRRVVVNEDLRSAKTSRQSYLLATTHSVPLICKLHDSSKWGVIQEQGEREAERNKGPLAQLTCILVALFIAWSC